MTVCVNIHGAKKVNTYDSDELLTFPQAHQQVFCGVKCLRRCWMDYHALLVQTFTDFPASSSGQDFVQFVFLNRNTT